MSQPSANTRDAERFTPVFVALGALIVAIVSTTIVDSLRSDLVVHWVVVVCVSIVGIVRVVAHDSPFAPYGFILIYTSLTIAISTIVGVQVDLGDGFLPSSWITERVVLGETLFILGLFLGTFFFSGKKPALNISSNGIRSRFLTRIGVSAILLAAIYRLGSLLTRGARSWNATQGSSLSFAAQLEVYASLLPLVGVCLLLVGDHRRHKTVVSPAAFLALTVWGGSSLLIGTRDELIAPLILIAWAYTGRVKRISLPRLTVVAASGFALLAGVGAWRSDSSESLITTLVRPIASGVNTTTLIMNQVPTGSGYLGGETYLAALRFVLPVVTPSIEEPSDQSGALRFPRAIGYTADSGLGFSPVAEAYWNFGFWGLFLVPFVASAFFMWAYSRSSTFPTTAMHILYPVAMARTPIAVRSDFLQQYKGILIVVLVVALALIVDRAIRGRDGARAD